MRYVILAILLLLLGIGAIGYRAIQVAPYPLGSGSYAESPNGIYEAYASNMTDQTFWGRESQYYEFEIINTRTRATVKTHRIPYAHGVAVFEFYRDGVIRWNPTSTQVVFADSTTTVWTTSVP